jgi:hypothetical protein
MPGGPANQSGDDALAALIARRAELQKIEQAGRDAELELKALDVELAKADEPQPDPYTAETMRVIEEHRLNDVDAEAFKRGRAAAQFPALVAPAARQERQGDARRNK